MNAPSAASIESANKTVNATGFARPRRNCGSMTPKDRQRVFLKRFPDAGSVEEQRAQAARVVAHIADDGRLDRHHEGERQGPADEPGKHRRLGVVAGELDRQREPPSRGPPRTQRRMGVARRGRELGGRHS